MWFDFRGNAGTVLSQTKALSAAARLRNKAELFDLVEKQLQWHVGRNPFCQSVMFGEGHNYAPQYTAMSGDMVGSLPVGIQTRANEDTPYWPAANCYNYKEVWVHPSARWLSIMADLVTAQSPVPARSAQITLSHETLQDGAIRLTATVIGDSQPNLQLRTQNLQFDAPRGAVVPTTPGQPAKLTWTGRPVSSTQLWLAVLVPDGDVSRGVEIVGGWK